MSCDEADLSDHLDWINDLEVSGTGSTLSCPTPRYYSNESHRSAALSYKKYCIKI